jgi:hypothetical protein
MRNTCKIVVRKPEENVLLGTPRRLQEDGGGMDLKVRHMRCQDFNLIHVAEYWVR